MGTRAIICPLGRDGKYEKGILAGIGMDTARNLRATTIAYQEEKRQHGTFHEANVIIAMSPGIPPRQKTGRSFAELMKEYLQEYDSRLQGTKADIYLPEKKGWGTIPEVKSAIDLAKSLLRWNAPYSVKIVFISTHWHIPRVRKIAEKLRGGAPIEIETIGTRSCYGPLSLSKENSLLNWALERLKTVRSLRQIEANPAL